MGNELSISVSEEHMSIYRSLYFSHCALLYNRVVQTNKMHLF